MILKTYNLDQNINAKMFLFHGVNDGQKDEIVENKFKPILEIMYLNIMKKKYFLTLKIFIMILSIFLKIKLIIKG